MGHKRRQAASAAGSPGDPRPLAAVDPTRHVVAEGETLASIARLVYGDARRWKELFDANRHLIGDNPARIAAGQVLHVPRDERA